MLILIHGPAVAAEEQAAEEDWFQSLVTDTPAEGFALAVRLSRRSVTTTQTNLDVVRQLRPTYANDAEQLIMASAVIAAYFQTVAEANDYWRD
ncbi:hexameric tyrosine-coordinated heme protein [Methylonatrum kenyense]|nr:hexameric tyrosine-coordinated heme protein [Methylonatrum kenyense]MCK8515808.1 hexameric tyrosine-coordinated heme protein [Methylonatrum kenyense]